MKIGAAARAAGITVKMARHYEAVGLLPPATRNESGSRLFSNADIHNLRFIGRGRSFGFSLQAIRKLLSLWQDAHRSNAETLHLAEEHMADLLHKQSQLTTMIGTLQELIDACAGDGRPQCPILDDLAIGKPINGSIANRPTQRANGGDVPSYSAELVFALPRGRSAMAAIGADKIGAVNILKQGAAVMEHGLEVLRHHPEKPPASVEDCVKACLDCLLACTACADACLSEDDVASMRDCIRLDADCAAACAATVQMLVRSGSEIGREGLSAQLAACAGACSACEKECRKHAAHHAHCKHCAEACEACAEACQATLKTLN